MGLESATFVTGLVATNPVGATDPKSQGDDHLRLIKSVLLNTFPALNAAVNSTPAELNLLHGLTGLNVAVGVYKAADTDRTTTTESNDPDLVLTLQPGTYTFELLAHYQSRTTNNVGHRGGMVFGGTQDIFNCFTWFITGGLMNQYYCDPSTAISMTTDAIFATTPNANFSYSGRVTGLIRVTVAGVLAYQWAQASAQANASRLAKGSCLRVFKIA
jgi:hypothetical protein